MSKLALCFAALTFALPFYAKARSVEVDPQFWGEIDLKKMVGGMEITALAVVRRSADLPNPALEGAGAIVGVELGGSWLAEAGDLWVRAKTGSGLAIDVEVPLVAATYRWNWGDVTLGERLRAEKLDGVPGEPWRFRNRLAALYPINSGPVRGIVATDEVFYDSGHSAWSRNRAQLGVELAHGGPATLTLAYLRQDDRFARPTAINAASTTLIINLP